MAANNKIALTNVRVFDGEKIISPTTVIIDGELIGSDPTGAVEQDCEGAFLLPGLIDAHIHLCGIEDLKNLSRYGVTTGLDMATWPLELLSSLRNQKGMTDIQSSGIPASAAGSSHSSFIPKECLVENAKEAEQFVLERIAEGSDYIKVVCDIPGPDQATVDALTAKAHENSKMVIAHSSSVASFEMAQISKVDIITHIPIDNVLNEEVVDRMLADKCISIPTLTMMEGIVKLRGRGKYEFARDSVTALYKAGVTIVAGTDANSNPSTPFNVQHGESLHHELELLVEAGLSNLDALKAATSLAADCFDLKDRGVIEIGRRADLILIVDNPLENIKATRSLKRVWCAGVEINHIESGNNI
ncbi:hypothetical protein INT46_004412 [Mucor plumbeus]|uniref:Amidohydrolase-related domain-containing protein n=1 Tax=Mucor plumbeus TaxID=97098 RepID=A0A8H7QLR1_9FUNG|nr:hypothetical protein INT46_004412 [Mucor plumbeus]